MQIISNSAISLDGRLNTREGRFTLLGSAHDHARMSELRAWADAVLVGGATFRNWPHPALPDTAHRPPRAKRQLRPWNVVVSRRLDVPLDTDWSTEAAIRPLVLTTSTGMSARLAPNVEFEAYEGADLPVQWILAQLERRGVQRLLVEAGGDLLFQFLAADALDELHVTLCPLVIGGRAPQLASGAGFDAETMRRLELLDCRMVGSELFLHYRVIKQTADRG